MGRVMCPNLIDRSGCFRQSRTGCPVVAGHPMLNKQWLYHRMPAQSSLVGRTFSSWFIFADAVGHPRNTSMARCVCGTVARVRNYYLLNGRSTQCRKCATRKAHTRHGMSGSRIYHVWQGMMQRCYYEKHEQFNDYGGRGIRMCGRWLIFENFLADMGEGKKGWTIERLDNNRNYEIENCCWATQTKQCRNKRNNVVLTFNGMTACLMEHCERLGIPFNRAWRRLRDGWPLDLVFATGTFHRRPI